MTRAYRRMKDGAYWNIRVPGTVKERAKKLAEHLKTTPSEIARAGIEKYVEFLEKEHARWRD